MFLAAQDWLGDRPDPAHASPHPNRGVLSSDGFEQVDPDGSTLLAAIQDAYRGPIVHGGIFIKVGFDTGGRFTRYQVRDIYTGP